MEMKTNSVDLLIRQMPKTRRTEDNQVHDFTDFKKMMRDRDLKKDNGNDDKKDTNRDLEAAAANSGISQNATDKTTPEVSESPEKQQDVKKTVSALEPITAQLSVPLIKQEDSKNTNAVESFQLLKDFRLKNGNQNANGALAQKNVADGLINDPNTEDKIADLKTGSEVKSGIATLLADGKKDEKSAPGEAISQMSGKVNLAAKKLSAQHGTDLKADKKTGRAEGPAALLKTGEKEESDDEAAKLNQLNGILQSKPTTSGELSGLHKTEAEHTTLSVQNPEELNAKLSEKILSQIEAGKKSLEVQLEPHNLGKILIKVSYEKDQVSVSVVCTENRTLKMLSQSAGELGNILENNLERPIHVIVDRQEADYLNNNQQHQGNGREQQQEHQQNRSDETGEDFIQKLRLGISNLDSDEMSE